MHRCSIINMDNHREDEHDDQINPNRCPSFFNAAWTGGGIIPFAVRPVAGSDGPTGSSCRPQVCFLFGKENDMPTSRARSNKWCDFSGRRDTADDSVEATSAREYYEETCAMPELWSSAPSHSLLQAQQKSSGRLLEDGDSIAMPTAASSTEVQSPWQALARRLASGDGYYYKFDRTYPKSVAGGTYTTFLCQIDYVPDIEKRFRQHRSNVLSIRDAYDALTVKRVGTLSSTLYRSDDDPIRRTLARMFMFGQKVTCEDITACERVASYMITVPAIIRTMDPLHELQVASFRYNRYTNLFEVYLDELKSASRSGALLCCVFLDPAAGAAAAAAAAASEEIFDELKHLCDMRDALMKRISKHISATPVSAIICGDDRDNDKEALMHPSNMLVVTFGAVSLTFSNSAREAMRPDLLDGNLWCKKWTETDLFLVTGVSVNECFLEKQRISWFSLDWLKDTVADGGVFGNESFRMNFTPILSLLSDVFSNDTYHNTKEKNSTLGVCGGGGGDGDAAAAAVVKKRYIVDIRPWCMSCVLSIPSGLAQHFQDPSSNASAAIDVTEEDSRAK